MKGQPIWTAEEDEICRKLHPDYKAIIKALKIRSYYACRARCRRLGLAPKRNLWSAVERVKLRKLYPTSSHEELLLAFPNRTLLHIARAASYYRITRKPKPYKPTGIPPLDQVRAKCFELKLTMVDLDAMCRTKTYFAKNQWKGWSNGISYRKLGRAIKLLEGEIQVDWKE